MRWNGFLGTLLFGALAAASLWAAAVVPLPGGPGLHLLAIACVYVIGLAPSPAARARAALPTGLLAAGVWLAADRAAEAALGAALLIGVGRSVLVYRAARLRGLAVESLLIGTGLGLACGMGAGDGSLALAVWAFFLVQSLYFWIPGIREREASEQHPDPFERARRRLVRILEDDSGAVR